MMRNKTTFPPASTDSPAKSRWPIAMAVVGGVAALGWMGMITASILKPDPNTAILMEMLREERELNTALSQQVQTTAVAEPTVTVLSVEDRDALLNELVTRSNQSNLLTTSPIAPADDSQQSAALLAAAIDRQNSNASALEQMAGNDPCIANLSELVQDARIPFGVAAIRPTEADLEVARQIAIAASTCPTVMVAVEGHTDPSGDEVQNLLMSWQRAEETIAMLAGEGFDVARFEPLGFGSRHLAAQGTAPSAAALNRRVQFHLAPMPGQ